MKFLLVAVALCLGTIAAPRTASSQVVADTIGPDTVIYTPERGTVTFTHRKHSTVAECSACHHASKPEKPFPEGTSRLKCRECHTKEPVEPLKTSLRNAYHITANKTGICFDCHNKESAVGKTTAPTTCSGCHIRLMLVNVNSPSFGPSSSRIGLTTARSRATKTTGTSRCPSLGAHALGDRAVYSAEPIEFAAPLRV